MRKEVIEGRLVYYCLIFDIVFVFQVVSQYSSILSPMCVDAVLKVIDPAQDTNVDLRDIKIIKKLG